MNKYLIISLLVFVFSVAVVSATATDFTADADVTISAVTFGASTADMLILNTSTAESWEYTAGAFTVTNPGTFKIGSSDSAVKTVRMTQGGSTVACAINTTPATSYVTAPTTAATYTVVPSALTTCQDVCTAVSNAATLNSYPTCGAATCDSGYGLSGSGGVATCSALSSGSGDRRRIIPAPPAPPVVSLVIPPAPFVAQPSPVALAVSPVFNRTLQLGATGKDVKRLQQFLNGHGFVVASTGPGSSGNETAFFGPVTKAALIKFQLASKIIGKTLDPGAGVLGPRTRVKINELGKLELRQSLMARLVQLLEQLRQLQGYPQ